MGYTHYFPQSGNLAVVALLLIMNRHAPKTWQISSDGDPEDWKEGKELVDGLFETEFSLPSGVSAQ